ncbi:MAG: hypothetical protein HN341_03500 [Verrucomicrobia bacterium]|jgi:hypothetical protein|nr:hypothetical protein [Verrucomicrobiota bacterium]
MSVVAAQGLSSSSSKLRLPPRTWRGLEALAEDAPQGERLSFPYFENFAVNCNGTNSIVIFAENDFEPAIDHRESWGLESDNSKSRLYLLGRRIALPVALILPAK